MPPKRATRKRAIDDAELAELHRTVRALTARVAILEWSARHPVFVQYFVKGLDGKTFPLQMTRETTTADAKAAIAAHLRMNETGGMRLIYRGLQLVEDVTLFDAGVTVDSTLHLVLRLCGD